MPESTYDDISRTATLSGGQTIYAFHKSDQCYGGICPVHKPTAHTYRDLPLFYSFDNGYFYRKNEETGTMYIDPDDYTLRNNGRVIVRNSVLCLECGAEIISEYRHHAATCPCGTVMVDGGSAYLKRSAWNMEGNFKDTSIVCTPENLVVK